EADGVWRPISTREVFGSSHAESQPPVDPKYFIPNRSANPRIEFWIDRPLVWPRKIRELRVSGWCFAMSGDEITDVRARVRKKIFSARFGEMRHDVCLRYDNRPGALRSGFSLNARIPPGHSEFIIEARCGDGPWEGFFAHPIRGSIFGTDSNGEREITSDYARWISCYDRLQEDDAQRIRKQIATFDYSPVISVLLPVYNSNLNWL